MAEAKTSDLLEVASDTLVVSNVEDHASVVDDNAVLTFDMSEVETVNTGHVEIIFNSKKSTLAIQQIYDEFPTVSVVLNTKDIDFDESLKIVNAMANFLFGGIDTIDSRLKFDNVVLAGIQSAEQKLAQAEQMFKKAEEIRDQTEQKLAQAEWSANILNSMMNKLSGSVAHKIADEVSSKIVDQIISGLSKSVAQNIPDEEIKSSEESTKPVEQLKTEKKEVSESDAVKQEEKTEQSSENYSGVYLDYDAGTSKILNHFAGIKSEKSREFKFAQDCVEVAYDWLEDFIQSVVKPSIKFDKGGKGTINGVDFKKNADDWKDAFEVPDDIGQVISNFMETYRVKVQAKVLAVKKKNKIDYKPVMTGYSHEMMVYYTEAIDLFFINESSQK